MERGKTTEPIDQRQFSEAQKVIYLKTRNICNSCRIYLKTWAFS